MATAVIMPRQGQSVESCIITEWNKKVGDTVAEGDLLFSYETDKATFEETAKVSGTLLAVFFEEDDDVPCLMNVAVIGSEGEDVSAFAPDGAAGVEATPAEQDEPTSIVEVAQAVQVAASAASAGAISPRARGAAERLQLDPSMAIPTGPNGRVIERDILSLAKDGKRATPAAMADMIAKGTEGISGTGIGGRLTSNDFNAQTVATSNVAAISDAPEYTDEKITNLRKVIAKAMHESISSMAQLTHTSSFDATAMMAFRKSLKSAPESMELPNITFNDIILYACSRVLLKHPDLNAHFLGDKMRRFSHVHLGMAVDTPRGLLVPTIFNADTKSLLEISKEAKALAAAAQAGNISPDALTGASFTISNLGTLGVEHFTPVVNPPQTGILGVNCIMERVRTVNGEIKVYPAMGLSLTYDHRAIDGAPASRFLMDMRVALENINALLIG